MPVGLFGILCYRHTTVMIVIAQRHIERRDGAKTAKKPEQMRHPFWYIEQISSDHDPIWLEIADDPDEAVMARMVPVEMQIGEVDGTTTSKYAMQMGMSRHLIVGEAEFPLWGTAKQPIEGMAQGMANGRSQDIGP